MLELALSGICEIHQVPLETNIVPLGYGLPPPVSDEYLEASQTQFPHSKLSANGGCVPNPFFRWAKVRACPKCNAAEQEWLKTHQKYRDRTEKAGSEASGSVDEDQK